MSEFEPPDEQQRDAVKKPSSKAVGSRGLGEQDFAECIACSLKYGAPGLCVSCLHNRDLTSSLKAHSSALESENASLKLEVQSLIELREAHYKQILDLRSKVAELGAKLVEATKVKAALPFRWRCIECESGSGAFPTEAEAEMAGQEHASTCPARLKLIDQIAAYRLIVADLARGGK